MKGEEPKRLTPSTPTTKSLFLKSGNRCAFPGCDTPLIGASGILVGEIAHIKAALRDGERFDDAMSNDERRAESNLMLMCATHHTEIDAPNNTWSVDDLERLKTKHEALYTGAVDLLRRQVGDITEGTVWTKPSTLAALFGDDDRTEELPGDLEIIDELAARLAKVPWGTRSVLAIAINKGTATSTHFGKDEIDVNLSLLRESVSCDSDELFRHLDVLSDAQLAWFDDDEFSSGPAILHIGDSTGGVGWTLFSDIKAASAGDPAFVRRVITELDFAALDDIRIE